MLTKSIFCLKALPDKTFPSQFWTAACQGFAYFEHYYDGAQDKNHNFDPFYV